MQHARGGVEVGVRVEIILGSGVGVASLGDLGQALEGRKRAADASTLVAPAGTERLAWLVAQYGGARRNVLALALGRLSKNGLAAGRPVFCGAATTGAFDLLGTGGAGVPVTGR